MTAPVLSILIPAHNEAENIDTCISRIKSALSKQTTSHEIIFIDDGSTDNSAELVAQKNKLHPEVKIVRLSRNFGKEAAITAGLDYAQGQAAIILDADCQDPPELIPDMLHAWQNGADIVQMRRRSRANESILKRLSAYLYYRILHHLSDVDIPVDTGDFQLMDRKAINALRQLPENNRYMKGLFAWIGMKTTVLHYDREPRTRGTTKWSFLQLFGLALQGITSFSVAPLRYATILGIIAASIGTIFGLIIIVKTLLFGEVMKGYPSLVSIITFLGGIQLFSIGILGEYVGKTYLESKKRPTYLVMEEIGIHNLSEATIRTQPDYDIAQG